VKFSYVIQVRFWHPLKSKNVAWLIIVTVPGAKADLADSIFPLGRQLMPSFAYKNSQIQHMIRSLNEHGLYYGEKQLFSGVLEYSFTSEKGKLGKTMRIIDR
jgi:hypothetical protein